MIIDESIIADGVSVPLLVKLIEKHQRERGNYDLLDRYYCGEHDIKQRSRMSNNVANNKVVCNHAKYITDMMTAYLVGNPVTYTASEEYDIDALINEYEEQDIANIDSELVKNASVRGRAYELVYADEDSKPRSVCLDPRNAFVVYSNKATNRPLFGVHYYRRFNVDGVCIGVVCNVYDDNLIMSYESNQDSWAAMTLMDKRHHYFGNVPLIEYCNNEEKQGDFEQLIPLIDAYNILQSDRVNDKEQFVDAFLFLTNIDLDSEQAQKLREERILMGYDGARAEYLSKIMAESDVEVLKQSLKDDIHRFSMVPDLSDESFGSNLSGVAIKYKLMGFEQAVRNKERYLAKSLKKRLELYINFLSLKGSMSSVPAYKVEMTFTRNMPVNELEISQMISNLEGIVTDKTLISQLSFVKNPEMEVEAKTQEQAEKARVREEALMTMAEGGGY